MNSEDDVPVKIKYHSLPETWQRSPALFWKPVALLGFVAFVLALPLMIVSIPLLMAWDWLTGHKSEWDLSEVERYLRSIVNTEDSRQLALLIDELESTFLYRPQTDPFLEDIRLRCQRNIDDSGGGGPCGFVDQEGMRAILSDVHSHLRERQNVSD